MNRKIISIAWVALGSALGQLSGAQVAPSASGPTLPVSGDLSYGLNYSQMALLRAGGNDAQNANVSGQLSFNGARRRYPTVLGYSGGYSWTITGTPYATGQFHSLSVTQTIPARKWSLTLTDGFSYRPQAPTFGLSGIAGTGEPITTPGATSGETILTQNTHVADNDAGLNFDRRIGHATSVTVGGQYSILRFLDAAGLNSNSLTGTFGLARRLDAHNNLNVSGNYSKFNFPGTGYAYKSATGTLGYARTWNRKLSTNMQAGPAWISAPSTTGGSSTTTSSSSKLTATVGASLSYNFRGRMASLTYSRATNGGAGLYYGAISDSIGALYSQQFGKRFSMEGGFGYNRTSNLSATDNVNGIFFSAQASRRFGRYLSVHGGYTMMDQSSNSSLPANFLANGLHTIDFGIGYSPRPQRIGQ